MEWRRWLSRSAVALVPAVTLSLGTIAIFQRRDGDLTTALLLLGPTGLALSLGGQRAVELHVVVFLTFGCLAGYALGYELRSKWSPAIMSIVIVTWLASGCLAAAIRM